MAYEQRDNSGTLFPNDKKGDNEKAPNLKGDGKYTCPHCGESSGLWVSAWTKTGKSGQKFLSLSIQPKEGQARKAAAPAKKQEAPAPDMFDDDIPF